MAEFHSQEISGAQSGGNHLQLGAFHTGRDGAVIHDDPRDEAPGIHAGLPVPSLPRGTGIHSASYVDAIALQGCDSVK